MKQDFQLSADQQTAVTKILDWLKSATRKKFFTLGGYAGTGKTTVIAELRSILKEEKNILNKVGSSTDSKTNPKIKVAFCSYTGKAARVLKTKLLQHEAIVPGDFVGTIHSLIYSPILDNHEQIISWEKKESLEYNLIIVDEASMLDSKIWTDLLSFDPPILAVGDHGQLPPINDSFQLLSKLDCALEKIHRQAEKNPLIQLSWQVRQTGVFPLGDFGPGIRKISRQDPEAQELIGDLLANYNPELLILCGFNHTRVKLNNSIRQAKEIYSLLPENGERVICLRNNHAKQIFNGMLGTIKSIEPLTENFTTIKTGKGKTMNIPLKPEDWLELAVQFDDEDKAYQGIAYLPQFNSQQSFSYTPDRKLTLAGDLFDFGYALTVHKAQGSQARKVLLFEERSQHMDDDTWRRWLYTAITRAEEELIVVGQ